MNLKLIICIMIGRCTIALSDIQTQYGPIEGKTITLFNKKNVDAFLGVPYAAPPTGLYRFASPQPPKTWNTILETKTLSKSCIQSFREDLKPLYWFTAETQESEDCLYLNVWRPSNSTTVNLPVMVWIHGGGFAAGSASMPLYDGSTLASEKDVIVVSMNYRMDLFGFFYMNSSEIGENVGLQDQIQAIRWVKENIHNFRGDPNRITLFGESAGAFSVGFHLVNMQVYDLFQNAIMESGTEKSEFASLLPADVYNRSRTVAQKVGCLHDNLQETIYCLRNRSTEELLKAISILFEFVPVRNGVEVPLDINAAPQIIPPNKKKNIIIGNVPREAGYLIACLLPQELPTIDMNVTREDMSSAISNIFFIDDSRLQSLFFHEYKDFNITEYDPKTLNKEIADLLGDVMFTCPDISMAKVYASDSNQVYFYYFDHKPSVPIKPPIPEWMGVVHGDEIPFVFGAPLNPANGYSDDDVTMSKYIMTYWTNLAKTGNPNSEDVNVWPATEPNGTLIYLVLDMPSRVETNLRARECNFWESIYPQIMSLQKQLRGTD